MAYVVQYMGLLHGPFETAADAASFGEGKEAKTGPWTIVPIVPPDAISYVSAKDGPGVRELVKRVAARR